MSVYPTIRMRAPTGIAHAHSAFVCQCNLGKNPSALNNCIRAGVGNIRVGQNGNAYGGYWGWHMICSNDKPDSHCHDETYCEQGEFTTSHNSDYTKAGSHIKFKPGKVTSARPSRCRAFPNLASRRARSDRTTPVVNHASRHRRLSAPGSFRRNW